MMRAALPSLAAPGLALALCAGPACAESYTVFDSPYGDAYVFPRGINSKGMVVGYGNEVRPSFIRAADGDIAFFEVKRSGVTAAVAINDKGWVAGSDQSADLSHYDGFIRKPDGRVIKIPAPAGHSLYVRALNNSGDVCGSVLKLPDKSVEYGFLRRADGTFIELERHNVGPGFSSCAGINDAGTVVGLFAKSRHAFIRKADGSTTTFELPDKSIIGAPSINAAGDVAGYSNWGGGYAFVRSATDGSFRKFSTPDSGDQFFKVHINAKGVVAGTYYHPDGYLYRYHGFVAQPGGAMLSFPYPVRWC